MPAPDIILPNELIKLAETKRPTASCWAVVAGPDKNRHKWPVSRNGNIGSVTLSLWLGHVALMDGFPLHVRCMGTEARDYGHRAITLAEAEIWDADHAQEPLVGVKAVAQLTASSAGAVYRWVKEGLIPHVRIGRCLRFRMSDVKRSIADRSKLKTDEDFDR